MKKFFQILITLISVSAFLLVHAENEIDPMNLPGLAEYVTDFTNVLGADDIQSLRQIARDYETKTTNQMVVVLIPTRSGNELFDIGMKIFNGNKIGQKGKNNGILLVIAT
ncbi:MAG: TPM domain-containing protein, partial [Candidatus Gracilibacteria bacterium]|nr:TPM domain-containing protein [Candidatus Gracilibacteria bacterium]